MSGELIGEVTHFYNRIGVAVVDLSGPIKIGDQVHFFGRSTDFRQQVQSMQIEHANIPKAEAGQSVGLKMAGHAKERDVVYKKL